MIKTFERNNLGRDLVVGDIHGHFARLKAALTEIGFDPGIDRLFSVGDLVDRGPESEEAVDWLVKPWFHAVMGNHEQMALDHVAGWSDPRVYMANGGAWFLTLPEAAQRDIAAEFAAMPIAMEIQTAKGLTGIVHAECPLDSWETMRFALGSDDKHRRESWKTSCLWSRDKVDGSNNRPVFGIDFVICGHTPLPEVLQVGNTIFIDTYGWGPDHHDGHFTFFDLNTHECLQGAVRSKVAA